MNISAAIARFAVAAAAFSAPAYASSVNLVTNGDFSSDTVQGSQSLVENTGNGIVVTDWTTTSNYTFLLTANQANSGFQNTSGTLSLYTVTASPMGGNFIAADSDYLTGTLSQSISGLTIGQTYAVSFYQALAQQTGFSGATTAQWVVSLGGQTDYSTQLSDSSQGFTGWSYVTDYFTATATTETLGFTAAGTGAPPFALLDGVTLVSAPEPASWTVMLVGLLGLAGARRWAQGRR